MRERLHEQFQRIAETELPQSRLGKAAACALARWQTLTHYAEPGMGHLLIDQNSVERAACRLSHLCASGSYLAEVRREAAFEGSFAAVIRPQWLEQPMVCCGHKPRQRELRTPTEAVVGALGVRNRRVSV